VTSFLRDFTHMGISKIAIILFNLGRGIILARWLGPENVGIIAALAVYPSLFMTFGSLGIMQSTTYFIGKNKYPEKDVKSSIVQIWFITTIISVLVCYFLLRYFSNSGENTLLIFLAIVPIPFTLFNKYNSGIFLGKNQIVIFNRINWVPPLIVLIAVIFLVVFFEYGIAGAMLALVLGPLFLFFILLLKNNFIEAFSLNFNIKIIKSLLSLGMIYAISLLIINLNYKIVIIIMDKLSNSFQLGIYSKGSQIVQHLWHIPMLMSTLIFARSANAKDDKAFSKKVAQLLRLSIVVIGCASIVLVFISKFLIVGLYGEPFVKSTPVLQILLPGVLLLTLFKVLNIWLAKVSHGLQ